MFENGTPLKDVLKLTNSMKITSRELFEDFCRVFDVHLHQHIYSCLQKTKKKILLTVRRKSEGNQMLSLKFKLLSPSYEAPKKVGKAKGSSRRLRSEASIDPIRYF